MNELPGQERTVVLQDQALRRLQGFTAVPNSVLRHGRLSYGAKLTFGVLLSYAWQDDFCWPAQERLAKDMQCSVRQVQRFLVELKGSNFINWKQQGLNRPNVYYILPQARWTAGTGTPRGRDRSIPDTTELSPPDPTPMSALDATPVSLKEYSETNTHKNVNVGLSQKRAAPSRHGRGANRRRWHLSEKQLDHADALATMVSQEIGQPENLRSYFVCAAEAVEAGHPDLIFEAVSLTKQEKIAGRILTTPSQYFHHTFRRLLRKHAIPPGLEQRRSQTRAARDAFISRGAFFTDQ